MLSQAQIKYESQIQDTLSSMHNLMLKCNTPKNTICSVHRELVSNIIMNLKAIQKNWHLIVKIGYEQYFIIVNRVASITEAVCCNFFLLKMKELLIHDEINKSDLGHYLHACYVQIKHLIEILCEHLIVADYIFDKIVQQMESEKLEYQRIVLINKIQLVAVKSGQCRVKVDDVLLPKGRNSIGPVFQNEQHQKAFDHYKMYQKMSADFNRLKVTLRNSTAALEKTVQTIL